MEINTDNISAILKEQIAKFEGTVDVSEVGEIISVGDGVARVSGLENVMSSELVELPNDTYGMALNLEEDNVGLVLFGDSSLVKEGDLAKRTGQVVEVPVGDAMVGRVVDPLGQAMPSESSCGDFSVMTASMATVQVIHNSASPTVDVYVDGALAVEDFAYRTATP